MMHHCLAVGGDLQVDFDAVVAVDRGGNRGRSVLDDAVLRVVQAAMGDRTCNQPIEIGHGHAARQETSNRPSTSTEESAGNTETPTVVRACLPLSPNAATIRSEAPFMTLGPSRKFGSELMKPPSLTTRITLSRSPSAAFS